MLAHMMGTMLQRIEAQKRLEQAFAEINALKRKLEQENIYLKEEINIQHRHGTIVGESVLVKEMLKRAQQVAQTDTGVLILGETGTGKELLARAVHKTSSRQNRQSVKTAKR